MSITLAATWDPRGEYGRFIRLFPNLSLAYQSIVIILPPWVEPDFASKLAELSPSTSIELHIITTCDWGGGRYEALCQALKSPSEFIHYADMDRLLRWVETRRDEWEAIVKSLPGYDCLVMGRSSTAYATHPQALIDTEELSNLVISYVLGQEMDISAGSKGFSRKAVEFIVKNTKPGDAIGTDAEWLVLLKRASFKIDYVTVDGLDWETADQYQDVAADQETQRIAAMQYDADLDHWKHRIAIAQEVVQSGLRAVQQPIVMSGADQARFDFQAVFDVEDYLYFYAEQLTDERTEAEINALVKLLQLEPGKRVLDLACGFGRHAISLAALGCRVTGVDISAGFLEIARQRMTDLGLSINYQQQDMRKINYHEEFDYVLLLFTSFGYFEDEENLLVLENINQALCSDGLLVFDIQNRDVFLKSQLPFYVTEKEGNLMIDRISFDGLAGRMYNRRIVIRNGFRKDKPFFVRLYNPNEIQELLNDAGFRVNDIYGGWDAQPLTSDSRRMVIIAQKQPAGQRSLHV